MLMENEKLTNEHRHTLIKQHTIWKRSLYVSSFLNASIRKDYGLLDLLLFSLQPEYDYKPLLWEAGEKIMASSSNDALDKSLRYFRNRHMSCIALQDLSFSFSLSDLLEYLSALADQLIRCAIQWHYHSLAELHGYPLDDHGNQVPVVILAMGKLGACELNYSSDIDLILSYERDGETTGSKPLTHHEFFLKLAQRFYQSLNKVTADGFVFRVDLRLRPYGNSGPLVMSFSAMEDYYQTQGREWERYAMIKARPVGMSIDAGEKLLSLLKPFVYRRYLDFGAIQSLRDLKAMIDREVARRDIQNNLKLGPGGIREIEFIAQVFQLVRGGQDSSLQDRSTPLILQRLAEKQYMEESAINNLIRAWEFLRMAENHIQEMNDRQEHALPKNEEDQHRLAVSMNFHTWQKFLEQLSDHREYVQNCFDGVFAERQENRSCPVEIYWLSISDLNSDASSEEDIDLLGELGYREPKQLHLQLVNLKTQGVYTRLSTQGKSLYDGLVPALLNESSKLDDPDEVIRRLLSVIIAIARRESYLSLLLEESAARAQLGRLCVASIWVTEAISRIPMLLDELIDHRTLYSPPDRQGLNIERSRLLADLDQQDIEMQMERLRYFKEAQQLRIAAADITGAIPLMKVSDHLTWIAESLLHVTLELAWNDISSRYGCPTYIEQGEACKAGFAVIGFGKLGGIELGYGSDLDLVFLHDSRGSKQVTNGEQSVDNNVFFTRLAQRLVHLLATLTPAGKLYEVDMRLRPNGQSGMLVSPLAAFEDYQRNEAWIWEHQALVKGRAICGATTVCEEFDRIRGVILSEKREKKMVRQEIFDMRRRMRKELDLSKEGIFDLKQGTGGIVDIEFMVQYAVLSEAHDKLELVAYSDTIRILESAVRIGWLDKDTGGGLIEAYQQYRNLIHRRVLQGQDQCVNMSEFKPYRQQVTSAWLKIFGEQA